MKGMGGKGNVLPLASVDQKQRAACHSLSDLTQARAYTMNSIPTEGGVVGCPEKCVLWGQLILYLFIHNSLINPHPLLVQFLIPSCSYIVWAVYIVKLNVQCL